MRLQVRSLPLLSGLRSGIAVSCGVGCRLGLDPVLLWLWHRPAATAPNRPLAWESPYATGAALEKAKRQKQTEVPARQTHCTCAKTLGCPISSPRSWDGEESPPLFKDAAQHSRYGTAPQQSTSQLWLETVRNAKGWHGVQDGRAEGVMGNTQYQFMQMPSPEPGHSPLLGWPVDPSNGLGFC